MRDVLGIGAAVFGLFVLGVGPAAAQQPYTQPYLPPRPTSPFARPQLSPYLNLLRGGSPAANYYLGVVPERDRRQTERILGNAVQDLERRAENPALTSSTDELVRPLPSTGHPTYFLNYSPYFNLGSSQGAGTSARQQTPTRGTRGR